MCHVSQCVCAMCRDMCVVHSFSIFSFQRSPLLLLLLLLPHVYNYGLLPHTVPLSRHPNPKRGPPVFPLTYNLRIAAARCRPPRHTRSASSAPSPSPSPSRRYRVRSSRCRRRTPCSCTRVTDSGMTPRRSCPCSCPTGCVMPRARPGPVARRS